MYRFEETISSAVEEDGMLPSRDPRPPKAHSPPKISLPWTATGARRTT